MHRLLNTIACVLLLSTSKAQQLTTDTIGSITSAPNIYYKPLFADSLASSFCIVIKETVKPHKHLYHSEHVVVIEGAGLMMLGNKTLQIKKGDVIFIPKGTVHSVKTLAKETLKVVSIQAPYFDGKDRIIIEEK